jgi:site-specific DNA-methyltransferase (adenine-specific)
MDAALKSPLSDGAPSAFHPAPGYASPCGRVTLYLGDCLEIAPTLQGVDALISDPPYGIDHKVERTIKPGGKWDHQHAERIKGDKVPFDPAPWLSYPISAMWGANHYADKLPPSAGWMVWDKRRGGTHSTFIASDCELAWCNSIGSVKIFSHLWAGLCRESEVGDHLHPMQKPVVLMAWMMDQAKVPAGGVVLDPYMGSGSTIIAAIRTGRRAIGIEIDPTHYATALERITNELAQGDLFLGHNETSPSVGAKEK